MPWPRDRFGRVFGHALRLALGAALCLFQGCLSLFPTAAWSQDYLALLEVQIDGRNTEQVGSFVLRNGMAYASRAQWRDLGLGLPMGSKQAKAAADGGPVEPVEPDLLAANALPGMHAMLDLAAQTLKLQRAPDPNALTVVVANSAAPLAVSPSSLGGLLNVDAVAQRGAGGVSTSALLQGRVFGSVGVLEGDFVAASRARTHLQRLTSTFTHSDPNRMRRLRAGDIISGGVGWSRPVRMAGLQAATDFALRPDLATAPMPVLAGSAAVPSTVELLVNGVRQLSQPIEAGRFELRQAPTLSGLVDVTVMVRDPLGRESLQTLPFYASNRQLAEGLSVYSVEAGRVRRGFATMTDQYTDYAAAATWRHGLSSAITLEGHAEATRGAVLAGGGGLLNLGVWGMVNAALAGSHSAGRNGGLVNLGLERQTPTLSVNLALQRASRGYRDIAAAQGDPTPLRSSRVGASWNLKSNGSVGLALVDSVSSLPDQPPARTRIASASYNTQVAGAQVFVGGYRDLSPATAGQPKPGAGVSLTLVVNLGKRSSVATTLAHQSSGTVASVYASQSALGPGDIGWRAQADRPLSGDGLARQQAMGEYLSSRGRISLEAESVVGTNAARIGFRGAVLALDGGLHVAPAASDSVALVDVAGQPGVAVYHEHRWVGNTNSAGQIVVPGLMSYQRNRLAIDPLDLPMDAQIERLTQDVTPPDRSGLVVRFSLDRTRTALVLLRDVHGDPPPVGARARLVGRADSTTLGHDGQVYLRGLGETNELRLDWGRSAGCVARFAWASLDARTGRIGPLTCTPDTEDIANAQR